ncbi:hypothetical protein V7150_19645 [Neobacillus drentensis]|uniref:hypothetical protein n=1 Tax=Neobacillus drentensis TaxID=220684 RepID=UPI002FFD7B27
MKLKLLFLTLALLLSVPGLTAANDSLPVDHEEKPCDCKEGKQHQMMHKDWQALMKEREQKLLTWVDQYTPSKKAEWTQVLTEKKTLRNQWMSPENAAKREKWKKDRMVKMEELKKQFNEGKITKKEFMKQVHGGKKMEHWQTFRDLNMAIENKDDKKAVVLLNQLLNQMKEHNKMMKDMLKK